MSQPYVSTSRALHTTTSTHLMYLMYLISIIFIIQVFDSTWIFDETHYAIIHGAIADIS